MVTPLHIERTVGLSEGNIFAGEFLAPQMYSFRPAPGYADYRTPITGYYQCGSGTHPGGCVMGAPGKLAAQRIVRDRDRGGLGEGEGEREEVATGRVPGPDRRHRGLVLDHRGDRPGTRDARRELR